MDKPAQPSAVDRSYPPDDLQRQFWDSWNSANRLQGLDGYMARQRAVAIDWVGRARPGTILEVGCGTGWLSNELRPYAVVTGIDLSSGSIRQARARYPNVTFIEGDFEKLNPGQFDFVVSADVISHVADHTRFVERIAAWTVPGGTLLLMTQNPFVWGRSSYLVPQAPGQIRNWPSLRKLRRLLAPAFTIRHVTTIVPGGDMGILRLVNHRFVARVLRRLVGEQFTTELYERAFLGREMVIVATRR